MTLKKYKRNNLKTKKFNLNKRENSSARGYDSRWSKFCFRFKHYNAKCYACGSSDKINVDHIMNKKEFPELAEDPSNFMPLCQSCHSTVTNKFEQKKPVDTAGKLQWIFSKRKETKTNVRIVVVKYTE